jgi:hypothetical protein
LSVAQGLPPNSDYTVTLCQSEVHDCYQHILKDKLGLKRGK